jgi:hypothetical protein
MFLLVRSLWRKSMALLDELGTAADRIGTLDQELGTLAERTTQANDLAVFADPQRLRQARLRTRSAHYGGPAPQARHRATVVRPTEPGRAAAR